MIPKWAWPIGVVVATVCYTANAGGHGWISFIAAVAITRLSIGKYVTGDEGEKWASAFMVATVGTVVYGVIGSILHPDQVAKDLPDPD